MRLTNDVVAEEGRLVADDDRYKVHDYELDDLTVSVTELKGGQETRGHSHDGNAEVYFFSGGDAEMEVGNDRFRVGQGAILIPKGEFHRVFNMSKSSNLIFIAVFAGKRDHTRAKYDGDALQGAAESQSIPHAR